MTQSLLHEHDLPKLKILHAASHTNVLFFHDGVGVLPELCESGILLQSCCFLTFSWYASDASLAFISKTLKLCARHVPKDELLKRIRFLFNSRDEYERARHVLWEDVCVFFSNAALLNEEMFSIDRLAAPVHDAVYNARANDFKRHHLSAALRSKVYLAYDWKYSDVDLESFGAAEVVKNVKGDAVPDVVKRARIGLMLSEEEGACYASLEYLLCGLPVVSTPSRGGRDEYYTPENSVICAASAAEVADAVGLALRRLESGAFDPARIREQAVRRINAFRRDLVAEIDGVLQSLGEPPLGDEAFARKIHGTNKLWRYRNMRIKTLEQLRT